MLKVSVYLFPRWYSYNIMQILHRVKFKERILIHDFDHSHGRFSPRGYWVIKYSFGLYGVLYPLHPYIHMKMSSMLPCC